MTPSLNRDHLVALVDAHLAGLDDATVVALLHQVQPALPELGLREFHTGAEALHGVAWRGTATVFPQPPGMAAAWDADLLREIGAATASEQRAKHAADPVENSLNVWAPVVNAQRHPLWGRNEEGYSEDPHVTAECAIAYASGLRGDHPVFWKTVPTLKHLLAYNNELDRCTSSSNLPPRVLHEYDLPAFTEPVAAGVIGGVMAAYNLVNGRPAHTSQELYGALREHAPDLVAVSDAYAPTNLTEAERAFATPAESHAAAILAGLDSFTDRDADSSHTIGAITAALEQGLLSMADVRMAARRLLLMRALTGELTPGADPYRDIPADAIDTPGHRELARRSVSAQVVILDNDGVLPLPTRGQLGVFGPQADVVRHDWYSGTPPYMSTIADAAAETHEVLRHDGADRVILRSPHTGLPLTRAADGVLVADELRPDADNVLAFTDWGAGAWTILHDASGFLVRGSDNGMVHVDSTRPGGWVAHEVFGRHVHADGTWSLQHLGSRRWLRTESWGGLVSATADTLEGADRFAVEVVSGGVDEVARLAAGCDTVLVAVGNDPHINGRETADRPYLHLPPAQQELWAAARGAQPAAVLTIVSSYPYSLEGVADGAGAIVWTSHGGQELGHGLLDVLDGRVEPTGRVAQTWWADEAHIGDIFDYDIIGSAMTWWYSPHRPLYPLGHGLTYGEVRYDAVEVMAGAAAAAVTVTNVGGRVAHELVQVYAVNEDPRIGRRLLGHARVTVEPGARERVEVPLRPDRLLIWEPVAAAFAPAATPWRVVAAPSAGLDGPSVALEAPLGEERVHQLPLQAWHAPLWRDVVGVPTGLLAGTAYRARRGDGELTWPHVEPLPGELRLLVRADKGAGGEIVVSAGGRSVTVSPEPAREGEWHEVAVASPAPGATALTVRLHGTTAVAEVRTG
ncbi:glycoside hydrolase family 3 C-terminal domain-containing protein [Tessaracoccus defluvii]|uniref:Glycoside hydrolase family 3 C-terminal domain-containing protein n=1 Tax=Tessaracoccus defluvii TaxID=1285901 RepID=A0A7H0H613_9ACTN|nr:glycoside hydrolase family 3 C-terminal domain-containing protein [Tessaracoccus defluvii]QNP55979.1 glycoside hydrolase family 3 C-terminal domain-containing protein [Tessaracoccus defluvii]